MRAVLVGLLALLSAEVTLSNDPNAGRNYLHSMLYRIQTDRMDPRDETENYIKDDYGYNNIVFGDDETWDTMNISETQQNHNLLEGTGNYSPDTKQEIPIEDLIKIIFTKPHNLHEGVKPFGEPNDHANIETKPETGTGTGQRPLGYYYYFYPLKNLDALKDPEGESDLPPELAQVIKTMKPMMPMMPTKMKNTGKTPVGPLFVSMLWFVGTALVFIVSILLMPRVRFVKVKSFSEYPFDFHLDRVDDRFKEIVKKLG